MKWSRYVGMLLIVLLSCTLCAAGPPSIHASNVPADATRRTITADADARVEAQHPDTHFGTSATLRVDAGGDPDVESYLRFILADVAEPIQHATLRVYAMSDTVNGPAVYATRNTWSEENITWNNRPPRTSAATANTGAIAAATWVEFDVTPLVTGNGAYNFLLATDNSDGLNLSSREGTYLPQLVLTFAGGARPTPSPTSPPTPPDGDPVLLAAGDIASCDSSGDEATAKLLANRSGTIAALGDNVYNAGTATEFANCYTPTWGHYKDRTRPAVGNHEYYTAEATGYFDYFGAAAGARTQGYYSYDLGSWHIVVLNSNCTEVGCSAGSRQAQWLRTDLQAHPTQCTLAYWHHPRFSSGEHGSAGEMQPIWQVLYDAHADVVLNGHDHDYERFAPQDPHGNLDTRKGIREFVVGTGGKSHYPITTPLANSEVHNANTFGVLQLTLHATSYDWQFMPVAGQTFADSGSAPCH